MNPLVIGIAGGSGSGKTTVARKMAQAIPSERVVVIQHDSYYKDRKDLKADELTQVNFDHPDSLDNDLLVSHLRSLREGQAVEVPTYDFKTHTRGTETTKVCPSPVIIVEGILVFAEPRIREQMDIKIFVDTDADLRIMRRVRRDLEKRGRSFQAIRERYYATVRPMHLRFVEPSKQYADLIVPEGGENKVAMDVLLGRLARAAYGEA